MREIKFRSFYNNKTMLYSDSYVNLYYFFELSPEKFPLMQFVRTDIDRGVSIDFYENDIVEIKMPYQNNNLKAIIFYEKRNCAFRAKVYMNGGIYLHDLTVLTVVKVLGNTYENPELLT
jgi:hypothetical protein